MDYRRSDPYYRRGRSRSPGVGRSHYRSGRSRSRDRSYSPERRANWTRDRRGRSPERYSSSWRVTSPSRRSRSRSYDRSRSGSRGRYSSRRSRSNDSYGRYRRDSSSSGDRRSSSQNKPGQRVEEIQNIMYENRDAQNQINTMGHMYQNERTDAPIAQGSMHDSKRQQGDFTAIKHGYDGREMDDEERFLYGDDDSEKNSHQAQKPKEKSPHPENKDTTVTPGGFDSNALKNVLKAIGFDFEMSAQQIQSSMGKSVSQKPEVTPPPKKPIVQPKAKPEPPPKPTPKPAVKSEIPQKIQAIQKIQTIQTVKSKPVEKPPQQPPPYYQSYDPYNPAANPQYNPQTIQQAQQVQPVLYQNPAPTSLGYPVAIPDPNNPGGTLLVYQPLNQPQAQQPVYHQPEQSAPQNLGHSGRIVLPPQREHEAKIIQEPEKDERQERLNYLQEELEKLKRQQNELMEKKRKDSMHGDADRPQGASEGIRQAAEHAAGIRSDSSDESGKDQKEEKAAKYDYLDPGNHWCRLCNTFSPDLMSFLSHLHSKAHRKAIDPYDRPWDNRDKSKKPKPAQMKMKALKGVEFLIPITGYYCTLCQSFSGDQICADEHLKGHAHNDVYKKHCKKNPSYEKKYKKKKKAAMGDAAAEEKKNGEVVEDFKAKIKVKTEKEEKWVEKVAKIESSISETAPLYPEFKPYASDKSVYHFEPEIPSTNTNPVKSNRQSERLGRNQQIERHQHETNRIESRTESSRIESRQERLPLKEPPKPNYQEPLRHDESHRRREKEKTRDDRVDRASDHGKRKRNWSPGYDEYERQQQRDVQNNKHEDYRKDEHERSGSRDRSGRWTEKSEPARQKEPYGKQNESTKKAMPGFGKFTWSSGTVRSSRRFEPAPSNLGSSHSAFNQAGDENDSKGKIAIKITGKTQYPARLSNTKSGTSRSNPSELEKKAVVDDLKKKVEALKRENALRNQLSSITIPSRRSTRPTKSGPNTAAVMLGTRSIGKHNTLLHSKSARSTKDQGERQRSPLQVIEADVSPPPPPTEVKVKPPLPRAFEPPPPGEEDMDLGMDADARSDASGISMELASDEG